FLHVLLTLFLSLFHFLIRLPPYSTLFPYTTLFRSCPLTPNRIIYFSFSLTTLQLNQFFLYVFHHLKTLYEEMYLQSLLLNLLRQHDRPYKEYWHHYALLLPEH